ncbi:MAG: nuclear transport factor 2 family protein [Candidatus Methanofastidiosa archaeon]|nr:nuclear transport factor 2 family protein [Candidatus Methanofastidiosa archaeon]
MKKSVAPKAEKKVASAKKEKSFLEKNKKIGIVGAVAIVLVIAAIAGFYYTQGNEEKKVEDAVRLHIEYYNTRNIDAYYDLISQNSKDKYGIKLEDISNLLNKAAFDGTNITIVNISQITIQGNDAEVRGVILAKNNQGSETRSFVELYKKENGEWKYEQRMWQDTATSQVPQ